ncbi:hypothetical protein [Trinickia violacea]|uniref:hypothetical protein n=1 Tax=Trinickia violacea TaxID=2571746 RepID=UPI0015868826|nr:hypothetical protein [Trinickia violacea]
MKSGGGAEKSCSTPRIRVASTLRTGVALRSIDPYQTPNRATEEHEVSDSSDVHP